MNATQKISFISDELLTISLEILTSYKCNRSFSWFSKSFTFQLTLLLHSKEVRCKINYVESQEVLEY